MIKILRPRLAKSNKGSMDTVISSIVAFITLFMLTYMLLFMQPYFSDKRVAEEYVALSKDLICRKPINITRVDEFLRSKMNILFGENAYIIRYYVRSPEDGWTNAVDITDRLDSFEFFRGQTVILYFKREKASPFEILLGQNFGTEIIKEGMVEPGL